MTPLPIGTKVRCIETSPSYFGRNPAVAGQIYTITSHIDTQELYGYFLAEITGAYMMGGFVPATPILRRRVCSTSAN